MSIFAQDGKAVIVAMDHARTHGVIEGLEDPGQVIDQVIEAGADGIMTTFGVVKRYRDRLIGRVPTFLRLDGGPSLYRQDWLAYTEWSLLNSVEDALNLGVDGVCVMAFMGIPVELDTFRIVSKVASECLRTKLQVMVEALPGPGPRVPDPNAAEAMASACRLGFEHGADIVKTYYTGSPDSFRHVIENCPAPVIIAGGPKMDSAEKMFHMVADSIQAGGTGVVFGRNIWQSGNIRGMMKALRHIVHANGTVDEAMAKLAA
jgi:DhnA family fructose-bisphosphate aldolase class Ia